MHEPAVQPPRPVVIEPESKRYKVVGPHRVSEVDPGGCVDLVLTEAVERVLIESGHLAVCPRPCREHEPPVEPEPEPEEVEAEVSDAESEGWAPKPRNRRK